jgi:hypothetical protein
MIDRGLIGDHYWVINGYGGEPPIEAQIEIAEKEIQEYRDKQVFAKENWSNESWAEQDKLYEFWLYKNMEFYWERVVKTLKEDGGSPPPEMEEVELPEPTEVSPIKIKDSERRFIDLTRVTEDDDELITRLDEKWATNVSGTFEVDCSEAKEQVLSCSF